MALGEQFGVPGLVAGPWWLWISLELSRSQWILSRLRRVQVCLLLSRLCRVQFSSVTVSRPRWARVPSVSVAAAASEEMVVAAVSEQVVAVAAAAGAVPLAAVVAVPLAAAVVALAAVAAMAVLAAPDSDVPSLQEPRSSLFRGPTSWPRDSWMCRSPPTRRLRFRIPEPSEVLLG